MCGCSPMATSASCSLFLSAVTQGDAPESSCVCCNPGYWRCQLPWWLAGRVSRSAWVAEPCTVVRPRSGVAWSSSAHVKCGHSVCPRLRAACRLQLQISLTLGTIIGVAVDPKLGFCHRQFRLQRASATWTLRRRFRSQFGAATPNLGPQIGLAKPQIGVPAGPHVASLLIVDIVHGLRGGHRAAGIVLAWCARPQ